MHISGDGKAQLFIPCMMRKAAFVEEIDDNDSDFKFIVCGFKCGARDNQIEESVIGPNVNGLSFGQELSGTESLRKA